MDQTELDELALLLQNGTDPDRAALLAQKYADWQANMEKQQAQTDRAQILSCGTLAEVQAAYTALTDGKSAKYVQHMQSVMTARVLELIGGGQ